MSRRTTINLDVDLAHEAKDALGAKTVTEAIHLALRESVDRHRRLRLLDHDFSALTPAALADMRQTRTPGTSDDG